MKVLMIKLAFIPISGCVNLKVSLAQAEKPEAICLSNEGLEFSNVVWGTGYGIQDSNSESPGPSI